LGVASLLVAPLALFSVQNLVIIVFLADPLLHRPVTRDIVVEAAFYLIAINVLEGIALADLLRVTCA
jgi:hypothetical protein